MLLYEGTIKQVAIQLSCGHDWHGPCKDGISRYYKCQKCYCIDRDCTEEEYYERIKDEERYL